MTDAPTSTPQLWVALHPTWIGSGFAEDRATQLWLLMPDRLKQIALAELAAGNVPDAIQMDRTTWVLLLVFSGPPRTQQPSADDIRVHRGYAEGNYCYDGTLCTYELAEPSSFLAFLDPTYNFDQEVDGPE